MQNVVCFVVGIFFFFKVKTKMGLKNLASFLTRKFQECFKQWQHPEIGGPGSKGDHLARSLGEGTDAFLSFCYVPDTLHTLSQLPEIIFGIRPVYKKIHK